MPSRNRTEKRCQWHCLVRWIGVVLVGSVVSSTGNSARTDEVAADDPISLEKHAVAYRQRIESARVSLIKKSAVREQGKKGLLDLDTGIYGLERRTILVSGDDQRVDRAIRGMSVIDPNGQSLRSKSKDGMVETRFVLTPTDYVMFMATEFEDAAPSAVRTGPIEDASAIKPNFFPVKLLGMVPMPPSLWFDTQITRFYGVQERTEVQIDRDLLGEIPTIRSRYKRSDDLLVSLWFAPEMDYGVVQAELSKDMPDGGRRSQVVHSRLKKYDGEIWFPEQVEYTCHVAGELTEREVIDTEEAEFNIDIDKKAFTLAGMDVPAGTFVVGLPADVAPAGAKVWDGEKLDDRESTRQASELNERIGRSRTLWLVWFHLGVATLFLILYLRRRFSSRGNPPS